MFQEMAFSGAGPCLVNWVLPFVRMTVWGCKRVDLSWGKSGEFVPEGCGEPAQFQRTPIRSRPVKTWLRPLGQYSGERSDSFIASAGSMSGSFDRIRVLIVEDNAHMSTILRTILQGFGVRTIVEVRDAADAFETMRSRSEAFTGVVDGLASATEDV